MMMKSHMEMADAPLMSETFILRYLTTLGVPAEEARNGENFPVWADLKSLDLPPTYLAMEECDPIRHDGFLYEKLLADAGED
jgi:acetyl esterase/lipase